LVYRCQQRQSRYLMPRYQGEQDDVIKPFVDAMKVKLAASRHKGREWREKDLPRLFELLLSEIEELREAIAGGNTIEIMLESADVGNYAMFIADLAVRSITEKRSNGTTED
jgi:NTP pyrophosphatase (non-canonical NTP hydrolase)